MTLFVLCIKTIYAGVLGLGQLINKAFSFSCRDEVLFVTGGRGNAQQVQPRPRRPHHGRDLGPRAGAGRASEPLHRPAVELPGGVLQFYSVITVLCSFCTTTSVTLVAGDVGSVQNKATLPRLFFLVAMVLSAASVGFSLAASFYVVEIRAGLLACMPGAIRAGFYALTAFMGAGFALVYGSLAVDAVASE